MRLKSLFSILLFVVSSSLLAISPQENTYLIQKVTAPLATVGGPIVCRCICQLGEEWLCPVSWDIYAGSWRCRTGVTWDRELPDEDLDCKRVEESNTPCKAYPKPKSEPSFQPPPQETVEGKAYCTMRPLEQTSPSTSP